MSDGVVVPFRGNQGVAKEQNFANRQINEHRLVQSIGAGRSKVPEYANINAPEVNAPQDSLKTNGGRIMSELTRGEMDAKLGGRRGQGRN
jgi:hypothetical protein